MNDFYVNRILDKKCYSKRQQDCVRLPFQACFFLSLKFYFDKPISIPHILNVFYTKVTKNDEKILTLFRQIQAYDVYLTKHINLYLHSVKNFHTIISVLKNVSIGKLASKCISAYDHCIIQVIKHFYS